MSAGFTVFGASGFVGRRAVEMLRERGMPVRAATRSNWPQHDEPLGHVLYTIGLTADFRTRPFETIEAHVSLVARLLAESRFDSFLFLSSTRIYRGADSTVEDERLRMSSIDPDRLYDLSKLCGEAICLTQPQPSVRVARLSNVFGDRNDSPSFLSAITEEALATGHVVLRQGLASEKDYVFVDDVVASLIHIAEHGRYRLYNVAAGFNTSHDYIASTVREATGAGIEVQDGAPDIVDRPIEVGRLAAEFDWQPVRLRDHLHREVKRRKAG